MSLKAEIESLADACETCADNDEKSYDQHLMECGACQEHNEKVEELGQFIETMHVLGLKPDDERYKILKARIQSFLEMDDDQRKEAVTNMLDVLGDLPEPARIKIVRTRTDILMELPADHRELLMDTLGHIMKTWTPKRKAIEQQAVMAATEDYMFLKRIMVRKKFKKLIS